MNSNATCIVVVASKRYKGLERKIKTEISFIGKVKS